MGEFVIHIPMPLVPLSFNVSASLAGDRPRSIVAFWETRSRLALPHLVHVDPGAHGHGGWLNGWTSP